MQARLCCLGLVVVSTAATSFVQSDATRMLDRAIAAAGGEKALSAATVLKWSATATVHTSRGPLRIAGRWLVEPPERAVVATWDAEKGEATMRRMLVDKTGGWLENGPERTPMPATILANERDQFYLYSIMRLVPLRERDVELSTSDPRTLLIGHLRRPDVEAFFDESGRLARLRTTVSHPANNSDIVQEVILEGRTSAGGVTWPQTIRILQDGKPFFDMELTEFAIGSAEEMSTALAKPAAAQRFMRWRTSPNFLISSP